MNGTKENLYSLSIIIIYPKKFLPRKKFVGLWINPNKFLQGYYSGIRKLFYTNDLIGNDFPQIFFVMFTRKNFKEISAGLIKLSKSDPTNFCPPT